MTGQWAEDLDRARDGWRGLLRELVEHEGVYVVGALDCMLAIVPDRIRELTIARLRQARDGDPRHLGMAIESALTQFEQYLAAALCAWAEALPAERLPTSDRDVPYWPASLGPALAGYIDGFHRGPQPAA